jgi:molybdate transport system ATP-binding protein
MAGTLIVDIDKTFRSGASVSACFEAAMHAGSVVVVFGPSGSGKTTLVRSIAGLEQPDRGQIICAGEKWFESPRLSVAPQDRRVGYVGQQPALFPHLSVRANIGYGLNGRSTAARERRIAEMLALFDLIRLEARHPAELSGGEAQRVALARALAPEPRMVLLDEPFAALDVTARVRLRSDLRSIVRRLGASVVLVTHDRTDAIAIGDELIVLAAGRVRQVGPVLDVFRRPADLVVARTVGVESVVPARVVRSENGLVELAVAAHIMRAVDDEARGGQPEVFACIRAEDVTLQRTAAAGVSARNHLSGRIVAIESEGALERVTVDCGFPLVSLITRDAREELSLAEGSPIVAAIKAAAVHLVPRSD